MGLGYKMHTDMDFSDEMRPHANEVYRTLWPGCDIFRLSQDNYAPAHPLDKHFGVDLLIKLRTKVQFALQEKCRRGNVLGKYGCQLGLEWENAAGSMAYRSPGETQKVVADFYFEGWANPTHTGFAKWVLVRMRELKELIDKNGGVRPIGYPRGNKDNGASWYACPLFYIKDLIQASYGLEKKDYEQGPVDDRGYPIQPGGQQTSPGPGIVDERFGRL